MVRVGPERYEESLRKTHVHPVDFTGRPMKGYVFVESAGCRTAKEVCRWVERGADFVETKEGSPAVASSILHINAAQS